MQPTRPGTELTTGSSIRGGRPLAVQSARPPEPRMGLEAAGPAPRMDARQLLRGLARRWLLALTLGLLLSTAAGVAAWNLVPAPYTAFALIKVSAVAPRILEAPDERDKFDVFLRTQMALVKGHFVLNAALRRPEISRLATLRAQEPHQLQYLERNIRVVSASSPELMKIELSGEDPKDLAAIVNAVKDAYLEEAVYSARSKMIDRLGMLQRLQTEGSEDIRTQRLKLKRLTEALGTTDPEVAAFLQKMRADDLATVSKVRREYQLQVAFLEKELEALLSASEAPPTIPDAIIDARVDLDPDVRSAEASIASLEKYLADNVRNISNPNSPLLTDARRKLETQKKQLTELRERKRPQILEQFQADAALRRADAEKQLREKLSLMKTQLAVAEEEYARAEERSKNTGTQSYELEDIGSGIERLEESLAKITAKIEVLKPELDADPRVQALQPAEPPTMRNMKPRYAVTGAASLGVFALVIFGIAFLEAQARRLTSVTEVVTDLNLRVMGALPTLPNWVRRGSGTRNASRRAFWHSVLTESIDSTRTMLLRDANLDAIQVVLVGSAVSGEGKTTLSCHLASSLARAGRRTLLVDGDMRRPSANRVLNQPLEPGLIDLLRGTAKLEDVLRTTVEGGPLFIPAGRYIQEVPQLLATPGRLASVFEQIREQFEFIVFDSAPVLPVTDSLLLAQHVDGVIMSVRRNVSRLAKVGAACERFAMLGVPILGAVTIGLDSETTGYGYRYGYGYGAHARYYRPAATQG